jgi:hypothetical protein
MRFLDKRSWTSIETEDSIIFTIVRSRGLLPSLIVPFVVIVGFCQAYRAHNWFWLAVALVGLAAGVADWLHGNTTELTVSRSEIVVRGNVGKIFGDRISISAVGLRSLTYDAGGEDDDSGLCALYAYGRTCLIKGLNEEESIKIATEIYHRFPDLESGDTNSDSLLFRDQPIDLGLSRRN